MRLHAIVSSVLALVLILVLEPGALGRPMVTFQLKSSAFSNGATMDTYLLAELFENHMNSERQKAV
jgi:hypothetical protein